MTRSPSRSSWASMANPMQMMMSTLSDFRYTPPPPNLILFSSPYPSFPLFFLSPLILFLLSQPFLILSPSPTLSLLISLVTHFKHQAYKQNKAFIERHNSKPARTHDVAMNSFGMSTLSMLSSLSSLLVSVSIYSYV